MRKLMRSGVLALGLLAGTAGAAWAECAETIHSDGMHGRLLSTMTFYRWETTVMTDLRFMTVYREVEVGTYILHDGSRIEIECGTSSPGYVLAH